MGLHQAHVVARQGEVVGGAEATGPRSDDRDAQPRGGGGGGQRPSALDREFPQGALEGPDPQGPAGAAEHARVLTGGVAYPPHAGGERVRGDDGLPGGAGAEPQPAAHVLARPARAHAGSRLHVPGRHMASFPQEKDSGPRDARSPYHDCTRWLVVSRPGQLAAWTNPLREAPIDAPESADGPARTDERTSMGRTGPAPPLRLTGNEAGPLRGLRPPPHMRTPHGRMRT